MEAARSTTTEVRERTLRALVWSVGSQVARQGLVFVLGVILARLLSPREFGLVAMVTVVTIFAEIFAELGFGAALVQRQDLRDEHLSSAFWLNTVAGVVLTLAFVAGAPLVAAFYREPMLAPVTMLIATTFAIGSASIVQNALLTRSLDFRGLSLVEIASVAISGTIAVAMALSGGGVWSLAAQAVAFSTVRTAGLWKVSRWRPARSFQWSAVRDLLGFSASVLSTNLLNYWVRNIDYLLVGRFLGTAALGIYSKAYSVMLFPLANVSRVVSNVMFPSLSMIQGDKPRVREVYLRMTRVVALVTFPMMLGLFAVVEAFVLAVFGPKWTEMIPILRLFCVVGMTQSIVTLNGNLYQSQGRADLQFKVSFVGRILLILGIIVGLRWGVWGVAMGFVIASLLNLYPNIAFAGKLVGLTFADVARSLAGVFGCAAAMAGAVRGAEACLPPAWPAWGRLGVAVLVGMVAYGVLLHALGIEAYREARRLVWGMLAPRVPRVGKALEGPA